ncbi:MAG: alpha/beta hydrolase [Beijerinckiaceae bacterium]|nr:alpha/beta hydrolase [Beijerinckiaceae bacterium]
MNARSHELQIVPLAGGDLAFLDAGAGPTIVLLHGIGSAAHSWEALVTALAPRWRVVAWNAPGYPPSAALPMEWPTASDYAHRLAVMLDHIGAERCHLVGHSLGCLIAGRFARLHPHRVATLTLASCAVGHARLETSERDRLLSSRIGDVETLGARGMAEKRGPRLLGPGAPAGTIRAVMETMASVDPKGYAQASRMLSRGDLIDDISALPQKLPVQFIYGSADIITSPEVNLRAAAARPGAPVTVLQGAGHACYVEQPGAFSRAIEEFANQHG